KVREAISKLLTRGNVSATLTMQRPTSDIEVRLNEEVAAQVIRASRRMQELVGGDMPDVANLMSIKGVLEVGEVAVDEEEVAARIAVVFATLGEALTQVAQARGDEGARLAQVISQQLDEIEALVDQIERSPSRKVDVVKQRLTELVARLV